MKHNIFRCGDRECGCDSDNVMASISEMSVGDLYKSEILDMAEDEDENAIDQTVWDDTHIGGAL